ncbi:TonB-dependent receptor, partial [Enterococcus faecium]|uniref:TonB-dependent receptor domain-containing protein n=1 Tax=Enterococcus faecium TaxID=1352 RepID=UPI003F42A64C
GGIKADGLDGRLSIDLSGYYVNFANQAVAVAVDGTPGLANGGKQGFRGAEIELRYQLLPALLLSANYSYNDARYRD